MAANLDAVMDAVAAVLEAVPGVHVYSYPPDKPELPALIVEWPETIDVDTYFGAGTGSGDITLPLRVLVSHVEDRTSATTLQELITSAVSELQADPTLGSVVAAARCATVSEFGRLVVNEAIVGLSAVVSVEVFAG